MPDKKETIIFLDFCGTCVPFQSAPRYIDYTIVHYPCRIAKLRRKIYRKLEKHNLLQTIARLTCRCLKPKELEMRALKGYKADMLEQSALSFYRDVIKPNLIPEVMDVLQKHQEEGAHIVLVSGGLGIYLKYFAADNNIADEDILSSNIAIKNGRCTGRLEGVDCMGENKVKLVEQCFDKSKINSVVYSDSDSDLPLLKWADKGIIVAQIPSWNKVYGLDALYWHRI